MLLSYVFMPFSFLALWSIQTVRALEERCFISLLTASALHDRNVNKSFLSTCIIACSRALYSTTYRPDVSQDSWQDRAETVPSLMPRCQSSEDLLARFLVFTREHRCPLPEDRGCCFLRTTNETRERMRQGFSGHSKRLYGSTSCACVNANQQSTCVTVDRYSFVISTL